MAIHVDPEPRQAGHVIGEIETLHEPQIELVVGHLRAEGENELPQDLAGQRGRFHVPHLAADPQERRGAGLEVKVGGILFHGELDQLIEIHGLLQEVMRRTAHEALT